MYSYAENSPFNSKDPYGLAPGDCYSSIDDAAISAINDILPESIKLDREYAGRINRNANGTYSYTAPDMGGISWSRSGRRGPENAGDYHTHGADNPKYDSEQFSPQDIHRTTVDYLRSRRGNIGYLGTPSGKILKFNPSQTGDPNVDRVEISAAAGHPPCSCSAAK